MGNGTLLVLAGDVMTGRGIDQILPAPGSPRLHESYIRDARSYVELAERVHGPVAAPVDPTWPWGEALEVMDAAGPGVRVMNLETSLTTSDDIAIGKGIHYRMSPANVSCLEVARVDVWALANNHVLDHGVPGLLETLETLATSGLCFCGAGVDDAAAWAPAVVEGEGHRVVVCSVAHVSSGVPARWAAAPGRPGVALLPELSDARADAVAAALRHDERPGDVRVVSIHWGANWGYDVPARQRSFAHRLVDAGVHVVHGHSSHHPRPIEVYRGRPILYGCGDLVNDYEGIGGYEEYRDDLRLLYLVRLDPGGDLAELTMVPLQAHRMRLRHAASEDAAWLARRLDAAGHAFDCRVVPAADGTLLLEHGA